MFFLSALRDSMIGKLFDLVWEWIVKHLIKSKDNICYEKYEHCKSYEDLLTVAIYDIADITKTDYNQIILCVNMGSHGLSLLVCADKIANGKQKYRIVANNGLIANCFHRGECYRMVRVGENPNYYSAVEETQSELVVPIQTDGNKLGVINSEATENYYYTNRMQRELQVIAKALCLRLMEMHFNGDEHEVPYVSL